MKILIGGKYWYSKSLEIYIGSMEFKIGYGLLIFGKGGSIDIGIYAAFDALNFWRIWITLLFFSIFINKQNERTRRKWDENSKSSD